MLAEKTAVPTLPVTDLAKARKFYEDLLGFRSTGEEMEGVVTYAAGGGSTLLVYETPNAGNNTGTAATFDVGSDLDSIVADLRGRGVAFEHYDMPI